MLYHLALKYNRKEKSIDIAVFGISIYITIISILLILFTDKVFLNIFSDPKTTKLIIIGIPIASYLLSSLYIYLNSNGIKVIDRLEQSEIDHKKIQQQVLVLTIALFSFIGLLAIILLFFKDTLGTK